MAKKNKVKLDEEVYPRTTALLATATHIRLLPLYITVKFYKVGLYK